MQIGCVRTRCGIAGCSGRFYSRHAAAYRKKRHPDQRRYRTNEEDLMGTGSAFLRLAVKLTQRADVSAEGFVSLAKEIIQRRSGVSPTAAKTLGAGYKRYIVAPPTVQKSAGQKA